MIEKGLLDYSVYAIVEYKKDNSHFDDKRNIFLSRSKHEIYHIGLIDFLQEWHSIKQTEYCFKSCVVSDKNFSAVPPDQYGDRFKKAMGIIKYDDDDIQKGYET